MQFVVRALDAHQHIQVLVLDAQDEADAAGQARQRQLAPLSIARRRLAGGAKSAFGLLLFAQELLALVGAGLSIAESLDTLIDKETQARRRSVLERLALKLREGQRLSTALRQQPDLFPALFCGLVEAAEGTSDLPQALSRYIHYETRLDAMRHRVVSAAVYPAILLFVGSLVSLFLLGYVVPKFATVYQGTGRQLPWASQLLMDWGNFAGRHVAALGAGFAVAVVSAVGLVRRQLRAGAWWRLLRMLPGARRRIDAMELSRLYLTLGTLLEGGISVTAGLDLCSAVMSPADIPRLQAVRQAVAAGHPLSQSLELQGLSTPVAGRLLRVGERSGQLGSMLTRTAAFYDDETSRWIERFAKAFEPALMAAIGLVIGLIVVLLYMPVFELAGSLQ